MVGHQALIADGHVHALDQRMCTVAGGCLELAGRRDVNLVAPGTLEDRGRQRVFAARLDRGGRAEQQARVDARQRTPGQLQAGRG